MRDIMNVVYNPNNTPVSGLPVIYGFNNGGRGNDWLGCLIAEDGTPLGSHVCSHEAWMLHDLGIENANSTRHSDFKKHYPDGYRMEFVTYDAVGHHPVLKGLLERLDAGIPPEQQTHLRGMHPEAVQWRNIQKVVSVLAEKMFGPKNHPVYGLMHTAMVNALTVPDVFDITKIDLEALPRYMDANINADACSRLNELESFVLSVAETSPDISSSRIIDKARELVGNA